MAKKRINVMGTLRTIPKKGVFVFALKDVKSTYLRNACTLLSDSGFKFSVHKAATGYEVTRLK